MFGKKNDLPEKPDLKSVAKLRLRARKLDRHIDYVARHGLGFTATMILIAGGVCFLAGIPAASSVVGAFVAAFVASHVPMCVYAMGAVPKSEKLHENLDHGMAALTQQREEQRETNRKAAEMSLKEKFARTMKSLEEGIPEKLAVNRPLKLQPALR
jgi:hypothetical protein